MEPSPRKQHAAPRAGRKSDKKQAKTGKNQVKNNPKAFTFNSAGKAHKNAKRSLDVAQHRLHVPLVDRSVDSTPPIIIAVVGPPKSGKSTLIRSLVKKFTKHNLNDISGHIIHL